MYIGDKIRMNYIDKYLPYAAVPNQRCLDLGCGNQIYKNLVLKHGFQYIGVDKDPTNKDVFKINLDDEKELISFVQNKYFSIVLCVDVLEHLNQPLTFLSYVADLLDTHGQLLMHVPSSNQTHLLIEPEPNHDHVVPGFEPLQIEGILGKFFAENRLKIIPTFEWNEALAWDLNYVIERNIDFTQPLRKLLSFDISMFVPYGMLIIGDK